MLPMASAARLVRAGCRGAAVTTRPVSCGAHRHSQGAARSLSCLHAVPNCLPGASGLSTRSSVTSRFPAPCARRRQASGPGHARGLAVLSQSTSSQHGDKGGAAQDNTKGESEKAEQADDLTAQAGNYGNRFQAVKAARADPQTDTRQTPEPPNQSQAAEPSTSDVQKALKDVDATQLVIGSSVFYGAMALAAVGLGEANGNMHIYKELLGSWDVAPGLLCLVPLVSGLVVAVKRSDEAPLLAQMRKDYEDILVPVLERVPMWGFCLMGLGAAVGEETLFRAFAQPSLANLIDGGGVPGVASSVVATSVVFGLLHAMNPVSGYWATAAGLLFGVEYQVSGLGAAIITHWLYDWFAFYYICKAWGQESQGSKGSQ